MQNISSILKCILKIHQILWTHELNGRAHFWPCPPKNHQRELLVFMNLHQHGKKLAHFIYSVLESGDQTGHAHFWPCQPKPFLSTFNLCEFILICQTYSLIWFGDMVGENILQSDWLRTFWLIFHKRKFSQML